MSLREKKKKHTRESILNAARSLFFELGYRDASMEMIAEASDVAVGTIYNYFQSKAEVMIEINSRDTDTVLSTIWELDKVNRSAEDLIWEVVESILDALAVYPKDLMRELMGATIENHRSSLTSGLMSQDERFLKLLSGVIEDLRDAGRLKAETEPDTVAFGIYSMTFGGLMWYSMDDNISLEDAKVLIAAMIGQFCRGMLPDRS